MPVIVIRSESLTYGKLNHLKRKVVQLEFRNLETNMISINTHMHI